MQQSQLINSYYNDGYVYCLLTRMQDPVSKKPLVKIGKTKMKIENTEKQVVKKLLSRYNTYYPEYDVVHFIRTGNCHLAEKHVFKNLKKLHYKKEIYIYDKKQIQTAFDMINKCFPNAQQQLLKLNVEQITTTNETIRAFETKNNTQVEEI
jgi:hypothetical protein